MSNLIDKLSAALNVPPTHPELKALTARAQELQVPPKTKLFASGDKCENFVLIIEGTARVQISTRTGREKILYRLTPGQSCALTTSCLLTNSPYYAEGISETAVEFITLPAAAFSELMDSSPDIFKSLLTNYALRIGELTGIIDKLMSRDLSTELKALLKQKADKSGMVKLSHKSLADELGSSREVISRKLKALEKRGTLSLGRGKIILNDPSWMQAKP